MQTSIRESSTLDLKRPSEDLLYLETYLKPKWLSDFIVWNWC